MGPLTRRLTDPDFAEDEVAELMDLFPPDDTVLDRVKQLGLVVLHHAFPVVDDDGGCAFIGASIYFRALVGDIRIGDRHNDLPLFQGVTVEHLPHRGRGAADDIGAGDDVAWVVYGNHVDAVAAHVMSKGGSVRGARTVDVDAPDRAHKL